MPSTVIEQQPSTSSEHEMATADTDFPLNYNPEKLPRELKRHYICADEKEINEMLATVDAKDFADLFNHISSEFKFESSLQLPEECSYKELQEKLIALARKNIKVASFLGDGLPNYSVHPIVPYVCDLRNLTTAYTPYQPERSQGTLMTHWIYQCMMSTLTGFEAINSSLYDRSTAIFEGICTAIRLRPKADTVIISEGIYPGDREVLQTQIADTDIKIEYTPLDPVTGLIDTEILRKKTNELGDRLAAIVFPQVNTFGLLEDVDTLSDTCRDLNVLSIAIIDPILLGQGGLKPPTDFGKEGVDIIVGEGQHLAIGPNFGGPGLGIFGVRFNAKTKNHIRQSPGRYVGKAKDLAGRECLVMVLSTREQHIRKERATSNICSNQAFLATLAGAAIITRGEQGMSDIVRKSKNNAQKAVELLCKIPGVSLAFPDTPFFNEVTVKVDKPVNEVIAHGVQNKIHVGVDVSDRLPSEHQLLKISFSDLQTKTDIEQLQTLFAELFNSPQSDDNNASPEIPECYLRSGEVGLPQFSHEEIKTYYTKLNDLNVSPDDACYPLGSCTMKYNPFINDWAASLPGLTDAHPQAPIEDVQGSLQILFETQEWFKQITGLPGLTTQPVAGAQGELVGLKLFQAYHRDHSEQERDLILIPKSAHGTNFATAAMAGFAGKRKDGLKTGILYLDADQGGKIKLADLEEKIASYGPRICGIMVTNPNTSGIFETDFKTIADKIHAIGGLVYMDGANMNAIAGWLNLNALGVDAVHNNLHKTWTIPHGGGGPGDGIVAVSQKLVDYLPGYQIEKMDGLYRPVRPPKSIGSFHRHWGNFAHKVRCYTYLLRLGQEGVKRMSAFAVLSARYLYAKLKNVYQTLPEGSNDTPRMHEFILTLNNDSFDKIEKIGVPKAGAMSRLGKLFLDFGFHAPTVAWPEAFGLMIEPTESYNKAELDRFANAVETIYRIVQEKPEALRNAPHFTPVDRIDDVTANRNLCLNETIKNLPETNPNRIPPTSLANMSIQEIYNKIITQTKS